MARPDPHSYYDDQQPRVRHLQLQAQIDFEQRQLLATATLHLEPGAFEDIDLDTRDLDIQEIETADGTPLEYVLHPADPILGNRLHIRLHGTHGPLVLRYRTSPGASALQWLTPEQTFGGQHPYLFSQCQAIHARSVVPLQDCPGVRLTYELELKVDKALRAVAAAAFVERVEEEDTARERYAMEQPIPPYLLAFAVGDLTSLEVGPRSKVWAEPGQVVAAAHEFAEVEAMIAAAETLFGPYPWERFDILTMPPSFPYGGMENPRLTFLTPTLLAGDRSLVNVLAHELAHSWTGNLVTNASAEHFWLNEGFTVYAERRILEVLYGRPQAELHAALGWRALEDAVREHAEHPEWTRLRTHLDGVDPDEAYSSIPYEKGFLFLRTLEERVGRPAFDQFLQEYIQRFRFTSITTEAFVEFANASLDRLCGDSLEECLDLDAWLHGSGLPPAPWKPQSSQLDALEALGSALPSDEGVATWGPTEWQLYLQGLQRPTPHELCDLLEERFRFGSSGNFEILISWLEVAVASGYAPAYGRVQETLAQVGRMKYLKPLYAALLARNETRELGLACFARNAPRYHPIARQVLQGMIERSQMGHSSP